MRGQQLALNTSHNRSIWFRNRLQARYPSSESKSYLSSCLCFKCSDIITVFSSKRKSEVRLNSSISVSGRGGAVCALFGISLGNSNSSSDKYYAFFPLTLDFLIKKCCRKSVQLTLRCHSHLVHCLCCCTDSSASGLDRLPKIKLEKSNFWPRRK